MNQHQFYRSKDWIKFRRYYIDKRQATQGMLKCDRCGKILFYKYDVILHHKHELDDNNVNDPAIATNEDNIMMLCFKCHNDVHERFSKKHAKKVFVVYGPPCSGKTTFVKNNARSDDLILDMDKIWQALSINDMYKRSDALRQNVFKVRDDIMDMIKTRTGQWHDAYVIGSYPDKYERNRIVSTLGAEEIYIECTKDECEKRAKTNRPKEWLDYIEDWFKKFAEGGDA